MVPHHNIYHTWVQDTENSSTQTYFIPLFFSSVETVIFCRPTQLQINLYKTMLSSRLVRRCLSRGVSGETTAPHLVCIGALKKLCNHPALLYQSSKDAMRGEDGEEHTRDKYCELEEEVCKEKYSKLLQICVIDSK